jgi:sterol desaturase/sphingolipid hydroxylase (fatty acid hydroxylase superfamily)
MMPIALAVIPVGVFAVLFLLERWIPLRQPKRWLLGRLAVNALITALAFGVNAAVVQPAAQSMVGWTEQEAFGLIHWLPLPAVAQSILAFLLMDLTFYYWHRLNHRIPLLWRFHNVHHIDPDLDVSTGFRFHFVEIAYSAGFRIVQVALIGVSLGTYWIYETIFQANTLFHHSNIRLPIWLEQPLNWVLVTPRMHGIHHSQIQTETNSNYSVVFPWWDRLHRTLSLNIPQAKITIGVPAYAEPEDNRVGAALLLPFRPQRHYWHQPDDVETQRDPADRTSPPPKMAA